VYLVKLSEDKRFEKVDLRLLNPAVYVFHIGDEIVYVGSSINGIRRPFDSSHRMAPLFELKTIELSITFVDTVEAARKLELELIKKYQPLANISGVDENKILRRKPGPRLYGNHYRIGIRSKA